MLFLINNHYDQTVIVSQKRHKFMFQFIAFTLVKKTNEDTTNLEVSATWRESMWLVIFLHGNVHFTPFSQNNTKSRLFNIFPMLLPLST